MVAFGRLGIRGLSEPQVHAYRKAWESAAAKVGNDDMLKIEPGDGIESPDLSWKDHFGEPTTEVQERVAASVMKDPVRAAKVLTESAEVRESMAEAIVSVDEARKATVKKAAAHDVGEVERAAQSQRWGAPVTGGSRGPKVWDDMEFARLVAKLEDYLDALDKGDWVPGGAARGLIASLPLHLDRVKFPRNEKTTAEAVQQFLNEAREESTP